MSERERWIVYPLLFLALGAALRDKIIKTTESQRIKCQGLCVFDSNDQPLLILGPEQFPELRASAPNLLKVDEIYSDRIISESVAGNKIEGGRFLTKRDDVGVLDAEVVMAKNFVLTDGTNRLRLNGAYTVPIMRFLSGVLSRHQAANPAATNNKSVQPSPPTAEPTTPPADEAKQPTGQPEEAAATTDAQASPPATGTPATSTGPAPTAPASGEPALP